MKSVQTLESVKIAPRSKIPTLLSRREFLIKLELAGAACVLPAMLTGCASVHYARGIVETDRLVVSRSELSAAGMALVETPDDQLPVLVLRTGETEFHAVSTRCTHRGCQVEFAGSQLACPCHGSVFALDGARVDGPAERALTRYSVQADATNLYISRKPVAV